MSAATRKKRRRLRRFRLGAAGSPIRFSYVLATRSERITSLAFGIVASAIGAGLLVSRVWLAGGPALAVGVFVLVGVMGKPKRGTLALDGETLEIGPENNVRRIALADISEIARAQISSAIPDTRENWIVWFTEPASKNGARGMAVALLEPRDADEFGTRLALRIRALQVGNHRALEALEVHHEAGEEAIGAYCTSDGWRAFFSLEELDQRSEQPFRDAARIPICMRADVWDAFQASSPELARRFELLGGLP
jgi:hypothetical protein